jgi:hypothetical protein
MAHIELSAKDNLLTAKVRQAFQANKERSMAFPFQVGQRVVLSTLHRRRDYKSGENPRAAKFMPRYDGPYLITATNETHSTVTIDMPHKPSLFPVFHTSEVHAFKENDNELFPLRALHPPPPVTIDEHQEFYIDRIIDEKRRGRGKLYLVRWRGEGPEGDKWLPERELEDCEALDNWLARNETRTERLTIKIPAQRNQNPLNITEGGGVQG